MSFKINYEDLESAAAQCKANASKPVTALNILSQYYRDLGEKFPPFQVLADKIKEAEENAKIIEESYLETSKIFDQYAEQGRDIANMLH